MRRPVYCTTVGQKFFKPEADGTEVGWPVRKTRPENCCTGSCVFHPQGNILPGNRIALVADGSCSIVQKLRNAKAAGARGVMVYSSGQGMASTKGGSSNAENLPFAVYIESNTYEVRTPPRVNPFLILHLVF